MTISAVLGAKCHVASDELSGLHRRRKELSTAIAERKANGESADDLVTESRLLKARLKALTSDAAGAGGADQLSVSGFADETLTTSRQIMGIAAEWQSLAECSTADSPFVTWEWMASWYETYEDQGDIHCLTLRDQKGVLVGVAPLFTGEGHDRELPKGHLGYASTYGPSWGTHLEFVSHDSVSRDLAQRVIQYAGTQWPKCRTLDLLRTPVEATCVSGIAEAAIRAGWQITLRPQVSCPVVSLPDDPERVVEGLVSSGLRRNCRHALRQLAADHPKHVYAVHRDTRECTQLLEHYFALNIHRRTLAGRNSSFESDAHRACTVRAVQRWSEAGWFRLLVLTVDGHPVAMQPFLLRRHRVYLLTPAWSPAYAQYRVSHLLFLRAMGEGVLEGATEADFLSGGGEYKREYSSRSRAIVRVVARERTGRVAHGCGAWVEGMVESLTQQAKRRQSGDCTGQYSAWRSGVQ